MFEIPLCQKREPSLLLKFKFFTLRGQSDKIRLWEKVANRKLFTALSTNEDLEEFFLENNDLDTRWRAYESQAPITTMLISVENKIRRLIPKLQYPKNREIIELYMKESKDYYHNVMKEYGQSQLLRDQQMTFPNKLMNVDLNRKQNFYNTRNQLKNCLLLTLKPSRTLLSFVWREIPEFKFDFKFLTQTDLEGLHGRHAVSHRVLLISMKRNILEYNEMLRWTWYPNLIKQLSQQIDIDRASERYFNCLEGLVSRRIIEIKQNALSSLLELLGNERKIPMLNFRLDIAEHSIVLIPSLGILEKIFASMVYEVANLGVGILRSISCELLCTSDRNYLKLKMDNIYIAETVADVMHTLRRTFRPLISHVESFYERYESLLIAMDFNSCDFSYLLSAVEECTKLENMLQLEPKRIYSPSLILEKDIVLQKLKSSANHLKLRISKILANRHLEMLQEICPDFDSLKQRVLKVPTSTEDLMVLRQFLGTMQLEEFEQRVNYSKSIGDELLKFLDFNRDHWRLWKRTLNWLSEIRNVRELAFLQVEHFSGVFRNHLRNIIEMLESDIEILALRTQLIIESNDLMNWQKHKHFIQITFRQFNILGNFVSWINKEETLLGLPESKYSELAVLKDTLETFAESIELSA